MEKYKIMKFILMLVFLVVIVIVTINVKKELTTNAIKEQLELEEWFVDNCDCLEKARPKCREGFELEGRVCRADGTWTNLLLACSKYDCSGKIYEFNLEEEKWEN